MKAIVGGAKQFQAAPTESHHGQKLKLTTRHLAALEFLLNVPMVNESRIRERGMARLQEGGASSSGGAGGGLTEAAAVAAAAAAVAAAAEAAEQRQQQQQQQEDASSPASNTGDPTPAYAPPGSKKLPGPSATTVHVPLLFRYTLSRISDQAAVVRRWEDQLLGGPPPTPSSLLHNSRIFFSSKRAYPTSVFSVLPYDIAKEELREKGRMASDLRGGEVFDLPKRDWRGCSYKLLFKSMAEQVHPDVFERGYMHDPNIIDNPQLLHAEFRFELQRGVKTGPLITSVLAYVNEKELKESLNEEFRERHPNLPPSLTLSKIRNLKKSALLGCLSLSIEVSTAALAVIYFERLVLKSVVTKNNRHLTMAACLLLAYKFNEPQQAGAGVAAAARLEALLQFVDREWEVSKKEVFDAEFGAFVQLGFSLHAPHQHIFLVYSRLLKLAHKTSKTYLGDSMLERYMVDVYVLETLKRENRRVLEEEERRLEEEAAREEEEEEEKMEEAARVEAAAEEEMAEARRKAEGVKEKEEDRTGGEGEGGGGGGIGIGEEDREDEAQEESKVVGDASGAPTSRTVGKSFAEIRKKLLPVTSVRFSFSSASSAASLVRSAGTTGGAASQQQQQQQQQQFERDVVEERI
jgi:hypothetical protein